MLQALHTAATGMDAQQVRLDVLANNLANVNTTGFKKSRADFQDLLYRMVRAPGTSQAGGVEIPVGIEIGQGVRTVAVQKVYSIGDVKSTGNQLDLAIEGNGFFQVQLPNGERAYTRSGNLRMNSVGEVVDSEGNKLEPSITVPTNATSVTIGTDGTVSVTVSGQTASQEIGKMQLVRFVNPAGLQSMGRSYYAETTASGPPVAGQPGASGSGLGTIAQGMLEGSNVRVVEEMVELITGQRAFEMNSKVVSTADRILQSTVNMK